MEVSTPSQEAKAPTTIVGELLEQGAEGVRIERVKN